jgi:hypothetical protein
MTESTLSGSGQALNLSSGTFNATFANVSSTSGTNNVTLTTVAGTITLGGGTLSGATGDAFLLNGGTVSTTYSGSINHSAATFAMVKVMGGHTTGTITFNTGVERQRRGPASSSTTPIAPRPTTSTAPNAERRRCRH